MRRDMNISIVAQQRKIFYRILNICACFPSYNFEASGARRHITSLTALVLTYEWSVLEVHFNPSVLNAGILLATEGVKFIEAHVGR